MSDIKTFLAELNLFNTLTDEEITSLAEIVRERKYDENTVIFKEKSTDCSLYIIKSGRVEIKKTSSDNQDIGIVVLSGGGVFGEMSFIDRQARSASAIAKTSTTLLEIDCDDFEKYAKDNEYSAYKIILNFAKISAGRLRRMNDEVVKKISVVYSDSQLW